MSRIILVGPDTSDAVLESLRAAAPPGQRVERVGEIFVGSEPARDDFGPEAVEQFRKSLELQPAPQEPPPPAGFPVHRRVSRATGATVPWVRERHIGRNDPCPCEVGQGVLETQRWA